MHSPTKAELLAENRKLTRRVAALERAERKGATPPANVGKLRAELLDAAQRETATAEILRVISNSPGDVQPVFEAIAESARRLLTTSTSLVLRYDGERMHFCALRGASAAGREPVAEHAPIAAQGDPLSATPARDGAPRTPPRLPPPRASGLGCELRA